MASHGYGYMTFRYEADAAGDPVVHRLDGDHGDTYYLSDTSGGVQEKLYQRFDVKNVVDFIVVDTSTGLLHGTGGRTFLGLGSGNKEGGQAKVGGGTSFSTAAHELTHAFGLLWHDFRDSAYILSYGPTADRLSACSARYLAVTPFLNPEIPLGSDRTSSPTIEFAGETVWYAPGTERFTVSWRVADPDGIHQVIQWAGNVFLGVLTPEVKACRDVAGETEAVVSFEYDGAIPSLPNSSFSYPTAHQLPGKTVDTQGNSSWERLSIAQASPHHVATLKVETIFLYDIAISPGGDLLAVGTRDSYTQEAGRGQDGHVRLWDVARREEVASLVGHWHSVYSVAFSPDGGLLASAGVADDTVKLWDVARREAVATFEGHTGTIESVAFSPGGGLLASAGWDRTVRVWDVAARQEVAVLEAHTGPLASVAFSPAGGLLASAGGGDENVRLWDTATWNEIAVLTKPGVYIASSLAFSPDGGKLAAVMENGTIYLWDVLSEEVVEKYSYPTMLASMAFSPDGRTLFAALSHARIEMWDTTPHTTPGSGIPDWDGDGAVGFGDFVKFAAKFGFSRGKVGYDPRFDLDRDGEVGFSDFLILARAFGRSG